jgi:hypothetical protein
VVEVELFRTVSDEGTDDMNVTWGAEWGLRDDSSGVEDSSEDLAEL